MKYVYVFRRTIIHTVYVARCAGTKTPLLLQCMDAHVVFTW